MIRLALVRRKLRQTIETSDSRSGRLFDAAVQTLIVISILAFAIETLPNLSIRTRKTLQAIESISLGVFIVEYLLRFWVAKKPFRYATSFFGVIDFLAILPALIGMTIDTRAIRTLRLVRLLRLLKLARYNAAVRRLHMALKLAWEELVLFTAVALILLFVAAAGMYQFEHEAQPEAFASIFHALWWSVVTLTTVGYGDIYPITTGGKFFTFFVLLVGLGVVAAPTAMVASALTQAREIERDRERE